MRANVNIGDFKSPSSAPADCKSAGTGYVFGRGDAYVQNPASAQAFNRYAYCGHNPLRYTDPTGTLYILSHENASTSFIS